MHDEQKQTFKNLYPEIFEKNGKQVKQSIITFSWIDFWSFRGEAYLGHRWIGYTAARSLVDLILSSFPFFEAPVWLLGQREREQGGGARARRDLDGWASWFLVWLLGTPLPYLRSHSILCVCSSVVSVDGPFEWRFMVIKQFLGSVNVTTDDFMSLLSHNIDISLLRSPVIG